MSTPPVVTVGALLQNLPEALGLALDLVAGAGGLDRAITSPHTQKTGLALAGYHGYVHPGRVLVFGESEVRFLEAQAPADRGPLMIRTLAPGVPCVFATAGHRVPPEAAAACDEAGVPLLATAVATGTAIAKLTAFLEDRLATRVTIHAVLMDILGLGVLITGDSGIGKSECALDLILRGHRLVADDAVEMRRRAETVLIGTGPEATRFFMEVRGLGLIDVRELFGVAAVRGSKRIELVVRLERWQAGGEYDRLGLDDVWQELLGLRIPLVRMPVAPGRSTATLVEVAARNQLLKARGQHPARRLTAELDARLGSAARPDDDESETGGAA